MPKYVNVAMKIPRDPRKLRAHAQAVYAAFLTTEAFPRPTAELETLGERIGALCAAEGASGHREPGARQALLDARVGVRRSVRRLRDYMQGVVETGAGRRGDVLLPVPADHEGRVYELVGGDRHPGGVGR